MVVWTKIRDTKMAPLSKEPTGLILTHDNCDSHLNERGITIDSDLKKKNFKYADVTLAEIWSQIIVDKFPTVAEYIEPTESELLEENLLSIDQK